jgi:raffinose/stachyose/melibiose transport system substrate-binding protein
VTAGKMLRQLIDANAFSIGFNGLEDDAARTSFINGKAAMYLTGSWIVARVKEENPDFMADMIPVPFPAVAGGKGDLRTVLGGVNCGFAISSACKEPQLAVELLEALTDAQVVGDWCKIGRIPAVKTTAEQNALLPAPTRLALELLDKADTLQPYYDQFLPARLGVEHSNTTQNLFAGTMTPEEAAKKMAETARSLKGN